MKLSDFIRTCMEEIIHEWETFARTLPITEDMNRTALRDHAKQILKFVVRDIDTPQTASTQDKKSKGQGPEEGGSTDSAAQTHADLRLESGFDIAELASEYRALRASVIKLWTKTLRQAAMADLWDLIRFNEAIDQALMESIIRFQEKMEYSRDMFIGILSHDLRNPLSAIMMASQMLLEEDTLNEEQISLTLQIENSGERMKKMITDLLDITRINLGTGIPISRASTDIGKAGKKIAEEMQTAHPNHTIFFEATGDLKGEWDSARIAQIFSNLIGNAVQYGFKKSPIALTVTGRPDEVRISVHNEGIPIPQANLKTIFNSLTRVVRKNEAETMSLGLGLYITKEIVVAHGGKIDVTSSEQEGTTFIVQLPRGYKV